MMIMIFKTLRLACITLLTLLMFTTPASAGDENRHALVIGNSDYKSGFKLSTPLNDSNAVARKLSSIGYEVHGQGAQINLDLDEFNAEINSFIESIEDGSTALIYYAGHGAASSGQNYLVPILPDGVRLQSESDIRNRSILLQGIVERVERKNPSGVNVFFFDACRDGPVGGYSRSINLTGLTNIDTINQPRGSFIGFSTEYGMIALDGDPSGNSPFAMAMLDTLETHAATPIELFFKAITERVYESTDGQQFPIQESKLRGNHCIIECSVTPNVRPTQEFGTLFVNAKPIDSEICFKLDEWDSSNCGKQLVLPLYTPVEITVTANGYRSYSSVSQITANRQQLNVNLEPKKNNNTIMVIGGVVAAVLVGSLLLSGDSESSSNSQDSSTGPTGPTTITLIRP